MELMTAPPQRLLRGSAWCEPLVRGRGAPDVCQLPSARSRGGGHQGHGPGQSLEGKCPGTVVEVTGVRVSRGLRDGGRCRGSPRGRLGARLPCPGPQPPPPRRAVPQRAVQACLWATRRLPGAGKPVVPGGPPPAWLGSCPESCPPPLPG